MKEARRRVRDLYSRYKMRTGHKFTMRRKLLPLIRYSWDKLPEVDINVLHAKHHVSEACLRRIAINKGIKLVGVLQACDDCIKGKAKRRAIPKISTYCRATTLFGRVFFDMSGPMKTKTIGGNQYMGTFVDDYSRKKWAYMMRTKSEESFLKVLKLFMAEAVVPTGRKIKILRTDNDKAFVNHLMINYLVEKEIIREYTSDYTPQQNSVVESAIRDIKSLAVTVMNAANLHEKHRSLYGEAILYATDMLNDTPLLANKMKSPNEVLGLKGIPLALRYQFGSHALVRSEEKLLLENRTHQCLFVGFCKNKPVNSLRFYKLQTGAIISSQNHTVIDGMMLYSSHKVYFDDVITVDPNEEQEDPTHMPRASDSDTESDDDSDTETDTIYDEDDLIDLELDPPWTGGVEESKDDDGESGGAHRGRHNERNVDGGPLDDDDDDDMCAEVHVPRVSLDPSDGGLEDDHNPLPRQSQRVRKSTRQPDHIYKAKVYLCEDGQIKIPKTYWDITKNPQAMDWMNAVKSEYESLLKHGTWTEVDKPPDKSVIGCRWIFTLKLNADGSIKRHKARLVAQGFTQTEGVDYFETYSPVVSTTVIRLILAIAAINNWDVRQLDIETAYLNAAVREDIYMRAIPGFPIDRGKVLKLNKSLYGLKQSGKNWGQCLADFLIEIGMKRSSFDSCLWYYHDAEGRIVLLGVYVDDLLITGSATVAIETLITNLKLKFSVKDMGEVHQVLGMVVERNRKEGLMKIHQAQYIHIMLQDFDISDVRPFRSPAYEDTYQQHVEACFDGEERTIDFAYRSAIGCVMHLSNTSRPDIANIVRFLSQFITCYTDVHVRMVKRLLKYLESTADWGLCYRSSSKETTLEASAGSFSIHDMTKLLAAYSDASWGDNYDDATSNTGMCLMVGNCLVHWKSVKQRTIAHSTMESEYIALSYCVDEVIFLRNLIQELFDMSDSTVVTSKDEDTITNIVDATKVYGDNQSSIVVGNTDHATRRSRHINVKFHNVKDAVMRDVIQLQYISTKENKADFFTKCLGIPTFEYLRGMFMLA